MVGLIAGLRLLSLSRRTSELVRTHDLTCFVTVVDRQV